MPIPKDILAVKRPKNTVVYAYGKNKDHYCVKARIGCKRVNGKNIPINGPVIGHIINYTYVPKDEKKTVSNSSVDLKDWADIILSDNIFKDILDELYNVYNRKDALKIYCISILRVCFHDIKDYELQEAYENSFLSELYPDVALSKNTVSKFQNDLGKTCSKIREFMNNRTKKIDADHELLVDGTLKSNESKVNTLSDFSRKAKIKGSKDISVLYAFDLETMEPVCSKCYPGNMLDSTAYPSFIKENKIKKGLLVGDKGFPSSSAVNEFKDNPELHYLNPLKRNSDAIKRYNMYEFEGILDGYDYVTYKKVQCKNSKKWLYSYRNAKQAAYEEEAWLREAKKNGNFNEKTYSNKKRKFGTILLESDLDMSAETAYKAYISRWEIEIVMRYYKHACEFDETRVQDDYSVIGSEFCNFLSTVLTFRIIKELDKADILKKMTYKRAMHILKRAKKARVDGGEWELITLTANNKKILESLQLIEVDEKPKKKVGRPKKKGL